MNPVDKTYRPHEYFCPICGRLIITRMPTTWAYRRKDHRRWSDTFGRVFLFCSYSCAMKWDNEYKDFEKKFDDGYEY